MTPPVKEGRDPDDSALEISESEAPNDGSSDGELSSAESDAISQEESGPMNRELDRATSQEHAAPQSAGNNELDVENARNDPQEDFKEESLLIQIPIPRKWNFLTSGLGRMTYLNAPLVDIGRMQPLNISAGFHSENMRKGMSNGCYATINYKIPFQLSISWRRPFINRHVMRRMTLHLLCGRYFSQAAGHQSSMRGKQRYIEFLANPNVLPHREREILRRPLRTYCDRPLIERITLKRMFTSIDTKGQKKVHLFVRPMHRVPQAQFDNTINRKALENHFRSHHTIRVMIINTHDGWKYLCSICGSSFNNLVEFREHSCNSSEN